MDFGGGNSSDSPVIPSAVSPEVFRQGVLEHAQCLGMDPVHDEALLWIAEKSLLSPLPPNWIQLSTDSGQVYYFNKSTGAISWEHPRDDFFRMLFQEKKAGKKGSPVVTPASPHNQSGPSDHCSAEQATQETAPITFKATDSVAENACNKCESPNKAKRPHNESKVIGSNVDFNKWRDLVLSMDQYLGSNFKEIGADTESAEAKKLKTMILEAEQVIMPYMQNLNLVTNGNIEENTLHNELQDYKQKCHKLELQLEQMASKEQALSYQEKETQKIKAAFEEFKNMSCKREKELQLKAENLQESMSHLQIDSSSDVDKARIQCLEAELRSISDVTKENECLIIDLRQKLGTSEEAYSQAIANAKVITSQKDTLHLECIGVKDELAQNKKMLEEAVDSREEIRMTSDKAQKEAQESKIIMQDSLSHMAKSDVDKARIQCLEAELRSISDVTKKNEFLIMDLRQKLGTSEEAYSQAIANAKVITSQKDTLHLECTGVKNELAQNKKMLEEAVDSREEIRMTSDKLQKEAQESKIIMKDSLRRLKNELSLKEEKLKETQAEALVVQKKLSICQENYNKERERSKMLNSKVVELEGNIRVICRIRPLANKEQQEVANHPSAKKVIQYLNEGKMVFNGTEYEFDRIFAPDSVQERVFSEVRSAVSSSMEGQRVCIFAFGQTGSGKTYTMEGRKDDRGVNFRTLSELFSIASASSEEIDYCFQVSVLEVYNEKVYDLLAPAVSRHQQPDLDIRMRGDEVYVEGLICRKAGCSDEVEQILTLASSNRKTASNNINEHSSRSHLVLSIKIVGKHLSNGTQINGRLNLIDLAGSERLKSTTASGQRLKEAQNINRSLSSLGDVVAALGNGSKHVPYRNSKLTFLLQDSLRSNARVMMFVNINPAPKSARESTCSLNFAARCRAVQLGKARRDCTVTRGNTSAH